MPGADADSPANLPGEMPALRHDVELIRSAARAEPADRPDSMLDPDAIALSYWNVLQQPRSAWTWEQELRPWVEKF